MENSRKLNFSIARKAPTNACCHDSVMRLRFLIAVRSTNIYLNQKSMCITSEAMQYRQAMCRISLNDSDEILCP